MHQRFANWEHLNQNLECSSEVYCYNAAYLAWGQCFFLLIVIVYSIRIFLNERELVSVYYQFGGTV